MAAKRTIAERMADTEGDFRNSSLRRKQIQVAMSGNVTMLIWLGKQHLAQTDRQDVFTLTPEDAKRLTDEELQRIMAGEPIESVLRHWRF